MNHIVNTCPLTKFEGGLNLLHKADAVNILLSLLWSNSALSKFTHNSKSSRRLKIDTTYKDKQMQTFSDDYSQEFVIYNEIGIDISLILAYHHKFYHQNKKQPYIVFWYVRFCWHQSLTQCLLLQGSKDCFRSFCWLQ